jgi:PPOX class probable F420-dependent enzyme
MSALIPASHRDLLEKPVYVVLTTMMPDGQPQSTVVWVDLEGDYVVVNSAKGRQKDKNLRANPKVTVVAVDPQDPMRWIEVRGVVEEIDEASGVAWIDRLARKYDGVPEFYGHSAAEERRGRETRVTYKIKPVKVTVHSP